MKFIFTLGCLVGLLTGLTVQRAPVHVTLPAPVRFETCPPKPTPDEYRRELVEAAVSVGWVCHERHPWFTTKEGR